jgi:4-amino-4-deoxy-L-arabinose transferase
VPDISKILLVVWAAFLLTTIFLYGSNKKYWKFTIILSAISLAAAFALFSPYLNIWDEQFHALVGKNCSINPFHPKLYPSDPTRINSINWVNSTTWLHKQPLFLWQTGLSIKIFGPTVFAVRLPSILLHGILTLTVFRLGSLLFTKTTGFIAALLFMHSAYLLGLISGRLGTDHNDYVFMAYILLSFWAYFEWKSSNLKKWLIWIGIFVGCAVLTKWMVGLLVFFGWGLVFVIQFIKNRDANQLKSIFTSLSISIFVFLPWQIYTFLAFPRYAKAEMNYNALHLWKNIEGHSGGVFYHWEQLTEMYFYKIDFLIFLVVSIAVMFIRKIEWQKIVFILGSIVVVFVFFTFVKTKMPSFTLPVFPLIIIVLAFGLSQVIELIKWKYMNRFAYFFGVILVVNMLLKPGQTLEKYGFKPGTVFAEKSNKLNEQVEFIKLNKSPEKNRIVFGCNLDTYAYISWMFFTNDIAYSYYPSKENIDALILKGYKIVIINWNNSIPTEFKSEKRIEILHFESDENPH